MHTLPSLRTLGRRLYRKLPGRPLHGTLSVVDGWLRRRGTTRQVTVRRGGILWQLDLGQLIDNSIYHDGVHELDTATALARLARPGMTVLDVGANVGAHALPLARLVGANGTVWAFEPTRWASEKLAQNLALNPEISNVRSIRLALSDRDSGMGDYCFRSAWSVTDGPAEEERGRVEFRTLDSFSAERSIDRVDLIKLDVDGYEAKILRGARAVLARDRPILVVELGPWWLSQAGDDLEGLLELLAGYDYDYRDERTFEPIADLAAHAHRDGEDEQATVNVICLPR